MIKVEDKGDYQILYPPDKLRAKVKRDGGIPFDEVVSRAEEDIDALTETFLAGVTESILALTKALASIQTGGGTVQDRDAVFLQAHDLKGTGGSFDFPLISHIGSEICQLTDENVPLEAMKPELIKVHVDMLNWAVSQHIRSDDDPRATTLLMALKEAKAKL
ncbi:MAG: hypothetical protein COB93_01825 [Sneathiella sp.]|nr:MAG: hypothetical protein COB93_01825 [Sneathiella sp.]